MTVQLAGKDLDKWKCRLNIKVVMMMMMMMMMVVVVVVVLGVVLEVVVLMMNEYIHDDSTLSSNINWNID